MNFKRYVTFHKVLIGPKEESLRVRNTAQGLIQAYLWNKQGSENAVKYRDFNKSRNLYAREYMKCILLHVSKLYHI